MHRTRKSGGRSLIRICHFSPCCRRKIRLLAEPGDSDDEAMAVLREWAFLVVDDNPAALSILRSMLLMLGADAPREAADGASAMELVRGHEFDCITTDVRMEPMNGAEFVRWVRHSNEAANHTVRILAMSAYRDSAEINALEAEGANGFIGKPLSVPLLRQVLAALVADPDSFVEFDATADPLRPAFKRRERVKK